MLRGGCEAFRRWIDAVMLEVHPMTLTNGATVSDLESVLHPLWFQALHAGPSADPRPSETPQSRARADGRSDKHRVHQVGATATVREVLFRLTAVRAARAQARHRKRTRVPTVSSRALSDLYVNHTGLISGAEHSLRTLLTAIDCDRVAGLACQQGARAAWADRPHDRQLSAAPDPDGDRDRTLGAHRLGRAARSPAHAGRACRDSHLGHAAMSCSTLYAFAVVTA